MNVEATVQTVPESAWFKSSYSSGEGGECVEVAACPGVIHVRDSKVTEAPILHVASEDWAAFVEFAAQG
ncbi:DUF397 domain-containing protein [Streptomyces xantholiticus]|uniref:DUF397 domain-containing protein n=1 Tax=Streptomyces xantholiticus TaxID=68285 RepID=UPI0016792B75|nr:DUF397 domain-containing protein [Streptomyces xantholiticus]GGW25632.1 hypothetical protein GCM10010381_06770 [Streptomyces xantholiticus]